MTSEQSAAAKPAAAESGEPEPPLCVDGSDAGDGLAARVDAVRPPGRISVETKRTMKRFMLGVALFNLYYGLCDLSDEAFVFYEKDVLQLSPSGMQWVDGTAWFPYLIKPVYGLLSDFIPIMGRKRIPYIWISAFCVSFAYFYMGTVPCSVGMYVLMVIICDGWWVFSEVMVDTLIVEKIGANAPYSSSLQSLAMATCDFAAMLVAWIGGALLDHISPQQVFQISAVLPIVCIAAAVVLKEPRAAAARACGGGLSWGEVAGVLRRLRGAFATPVIWRSTLVMFLIQATPNYSAAMTYFFANALGFQDDKEFFGRRDLVICFCDMLGVLLFQRFLRRLSIRKVLLVSTLLAAALQLSGLLVATRANLALGIPDGFFLITDNGVMAVVATIQQLPMVFLAAKICPPGLESTLYATLMTVWDWAMVASNYGGACLTDALHVTPTEFGGFPALIAVCSVSTVVPLVLIGWVPDVVPADYDDPSRLSPASAAVLGLPPSPPATPEPPAPAPQPLPARKAGPEPAAARAAAGARSPAEESESGESTAGGAREPLAHRLRRIAQGRAGVEGAPLLQASPPEPDWRDNGYGSSASGESEGGPRSGRHAAAYRTTSP